MTVFVQLIMPITVFQKNVTPGIVLASLFGDSEKDRVIFNSRTQRTRSRVIVPLLHKQNARFSPRVWLKRIRMQSNHRQNTRMLRNKISDIFIRCIVEPALRQHNRHPSARLEEV